MVVEAKAVQRHGIGWALGRAAEAGIYINRDKIQFFEVDGECVRIVLTTVEVIVCRDKVDWDTLPLGGA